MTTVSVVVPTRGRAAALGRLLGSLAADATTPAEIVVVVDGEDDVDSAEVASRLGARVVTQPWSGRAAARNRGAALADGDVLLFLDDDIEVLPGLVRAHLAAHADHSATVALGDYPVVLPSVPNAAERAVWAWWEDAHHARRNAHRLGAMHVWSGNLSLGRARFEAVGGFDPRFLGYGSEDVELGHRLLAAGARLQLLPHVLARHHVRIGVSAFLARAGDEALSHLRLAEAHPELGPFTPLAGRPHGRLARLGDRAPRRAAAASALLAAAIPVADRARLRRTTARLLRAVREERYWRTARRASGGAAPAVEPFVVTLDVREPGAGLPPVPHGVPVRVALVDGATLVTVATVVLDPAVPTRLALARAFAASPVAAHAAGWLAGARLGRNSSAPYRNEAAGGGLHTSNRR